MCKSSVAAGLIIGTTLSLACGGSADSQNDMDAGGAAQPAANVELGGRFEMSSTAPFNITVANSELMCQRATPASAFRANWRDPATGVQVLVTGFPTADENGETRVDTWRVTQLQQGGAQEDARVTSATLAIEELSSRGAVSTWAVEASGTFEGGGTFTASGNCDA